MLKINEATLVMEEALKMGVMRSPNYGFRFYDSGLSAETVYSLPIVRGAIGKEMCFEQDSWATEVAQAQWKTIYFHDLTAFSKTLEEQCKNLPPTQKLAQPRSVLLLVATWALATKQILLGRGIVRCDGFSRLGFPSGARVCIGLFHEAEGDGKRYCAFDDMAMPYVGIASEEI